MDRAYRDYQDEDVPQSFSLQVNKTLQNGLRFDPLSSRRVSSDQALALTLVCMINCLT